MKIYQPIKTNFESKIKKIKRIAWLILYISVPVATIYGVFKYFENKIKVFSVLLESKTFSFTILIIIFLPIIALLLYSIFIGLNFTISKLKDIYNKNKNYNDVLRLWNKELNSNNNIYIPVLKIPSYSCFTQEFKNQSRILKVVNFGIEKITSPQNENWNIKLALGENSDIFYIIYHTDINDSDKVIHVAMNNIDNGDTPNIQHHRIFNKFRENNISLIELYVDEYSENEGYKILKYFINDEEIKVKDRIEKIKIENLHNLRLEIWPTRFNQGVSIMLYASIENFSLTWE